MVVVGGIIGAGIFLNPAIVAQRVHTTAFILAAWIIGGAIALIGALTFAELGARRPQAGGGYIYLTGDLIGPGERGERCPDSSRFTRFFTRFSRQIRPSLQKKHGTDARSLYETRQNVVVDCCAPLLREQ